MERTLKVVTGYRLTPVEVNDSAVQVVRDQVKELRRSLRRRAVAVRLGVGRAWAACMAWCGEQIGREFTGADARFSASVLVVLVAACVDSVVPVAASLAWFALELRGMLRREKAAGQAEEGGEG